ncbi:hypothetical protein E2C06_25965 [Dankookia rubra]|uniref:SIS domain-containing protein n=1 Tax=Dankookia rubra TaxID=1442381 RepID=A0A4R5Q9P4_9PROT|nr:hypothetical protein E2C06_25965 [Dankookia rubra]
MLFGRTGWAARALGATGIALVDELLDLGHGDALLVLAYGGSYREVITVFAEAHCPGLPIVFVTNTLDRILARHVDVIVPARRGHARKVAATCRLR